jgi:hypothetical protein
LDSENNIAGEVYFETLFCEIIVLPISQTMKTFRILLPATLIAALFLGFNNCAPLHSSSGANGSGSNQSMGPTPASNLTTPNPQIVGVGGDGTGWSLNGGPDVTNDVITLTDGNGNEATSVFFNNPAPVAQRFAATFVYQDIDPTPDDADGVTFTIQNSQDGANALGANAGGLGYSGIGNSVAIAFDINQQNGLALATDGGAFQFTDTSPIDFKSGDPIQVQMTYDASKLALSITLTDTKTLKAFNMTYTSIDFSAHLGGNVGYVGFTGGTGGAASTQQITNFTLQYLF